MRTSDLVSIGEAAILLRATRRQVVGLCARGLLPYVIVGSHRRVRRADVEALLETALTRGQVEQLRLHQAIAVRFVENPASVVATAERNLRRRRHLPLADLEAEWLERWQIVLDGGRGALLDALTSPVHYAVLLREHSPFGGVLSELERRSVLDALTERRRAEVRPLRLETRARILRAV